MTYQEHPSWIILEKTKVELKHLLNDIHRSMADIPLSMKREVQYSYNQIQDRHDIIVKLQLELEDKLCTNNLD